MTHSNTTFPGAAEIIQFGCLADNYCSLIHDPVSGSTAVVDTPDADEIMRQLDKRNWRLTHILTTHHHWDHIDGHEQLKQRYGCQVIGPALNQNQVPAIDLSVSHQDQISVGSLTVEVIATPGHTLGHVVYYLPQLSAVFVGDTLFSMGCGRLFEGSPAQMWESICQIRALPQETSIYCGHEYTLANARFALELDPLNPALKQRVAEVEVLRASSLPTIPTSVGLERATNPFMRADDPVLQAQLALSGVMASEVFADIRRRKDQA